MHYNYYNAEAFDKPLRVQTWISFCLELILEIDLHFATTVQVPII